MTSLFSIRRNKTSFTCHRCYNMQHNTYILSLLKIIYIYIYIFKYKFLLDYQANKDTKKYMWECIWSHRHEPHQRPCYVVPYWISAYDYQLTYLSTYLLPPVVTVSPGSRQVVVARYLLTYMNILYVTAVVFSIIFASKRTRWLVTDRWWKFVSQERAYILVNGV